MEHSPRPWIVRPGRGMRGFEIWSADNWIIATAHRSAAGDFSGEANAYLISAAPDLLELAKLYVRKTEVDCLDVPFRKACLSAIAKAEERD